MLTSVPGSDRRASANRPVARGFTLLELLIVVAVIAVASAVVSLSLRDPQATRLEREAQRLAVLLDTARSQSRALGMPVTWRPVADDRERVDAQGGRIDFRFEGLPDAVDLPHRWLSPPEDGVVQLQLPAGQTGLVLGPEPMIPAQRLELRLGDQRLTLHTDGLGPFVVSAPPP